LASDVSLAFSIRYLSIRTYTFFREKLHYPLPGLSSLRRWASDLDLRKGIIAQMLCFLKAAGASLAKYEKIAVISFDEMRVSSLYEYDKKNDSIVGPHIQAQVIMVRGLFHSWKQPLYIGFDVKVTADLLNNIIKQLHEIEYDVAACVSDCGSANVGLRKQLGVGSDKTYFSHPVTGDPIYVFADAPHLLKLVRNWLLDTGTNLFTYTVT
jgi:hypothetical protein